LFTARLAESPVIPLNATDYAIAIGKYISAVENKLDAIMAGTTLTGNHIEIRARPAAVKSTGDISKLKISFKKLYEAKSNLLSAAEAHDAVAAELAREAEKDIP
jgi:N-acetylated-alpha-linked acidic dipeptidase